MFFAVCSLDYMNQSDIRHKSYLEIQRTVKIYNICKGARRVAYIILACIDTSREKQIFSKGLNRERIGGCILQCLFHALEVAQKKAQYKSNKN